MPTKSPACLTRHLPSLKISFFRLRLCITERGRGEMKILCDVCCAGEATVLCCADEAALCYGCDLRVHSANKLAGKHPRFSLLSAQPHPLCDTCQERRGFVFCKDDRAILCHECDSSIHTSNGLTMKHSRFILTGTRLSSATSTVSSPLSEQSISQKKVSRCLSSPMAEGSSSISEYLTKMLPGYLVEDFLLDDSVSYTAGDVFYQSDALAPVVEGDVDAGNIGVASAADWNFFVPEAPLYQFHAVSSLTSAAIAGAGVFDVVEEASNKEASREKWSSEDVFAVPQLPSVSGSNKRPCRPSAYDF